MPPRLASLVFALLALGAAACKQDVGERCQVRSDCRDGLTCNRTTQRCEVDVGPRDAQAPTDADDLPIDAEAPDAEPIDAMPETDEPA
jgi:hypothetical protein